MKILHNYIPRRSVAKLFFFVGIVWAALVGPMSVILVLQDFGATNPQIGMFAAITAGLSMVFQPVWGMISDKIGSPRRIICFCLGASAVFFGSVFLTGNFYVAVVLLLFDMIFRCGMVALLDSHTLQEVNAIPGLQYTHIRWAGSVFFGLTSLVYGGVMDTWGVMTILPISATLAVFAVIWGIFVAKGEGESGEYALKRIKPNLKKDTVALLMNKQYVILIIYIALSALALQPLWIFLIVFITSVGGTQGDVSRLHAWRCVVEIPILFLIGSKCKNVSSKKLMVIGLFFMLVYVAGIALAPSYFWIVAAHLVGGVPGFIFGLTGRLKYLNEITPESVRSTSITLLGTLEIGLGAIIGNLVAGFVLDMYGTRILGAVSFGALLIASVMLLFMKSDASASNKEERV